ncbi:MAG: hypothetical protein EOM40_05285 [Clostridia bacterium]|nr:hypothetical protein [Clostridia bacterium]NCC44104.1 hypothetical protein [Clostridia bacterium]
MGEIYVDFTAAGNQIRRLKNLQAELSCIRQNQFEPIQAQISSCWKGSNGSKFSQLMEREIQKLRETENEVKAAAASLEAKVGYLQKLEHEFAGILWK